MISRSFVPFQLVSNWFGINSEDAPDNLLDGELDPSSINVNSDPQGALGSRAGYTAITSASIGSVTAWCGFYQFRNNSGTDYFFGAGSDGKLYKYASNTYEQLYSGLTTGVNVRWAFATLYNMAIAVNGNQTAFKYTGTGSATTLGGTLATADWCIEQWRYVFMHSTVDKRLVYYNTTLGDPESGYTSFLNFDMDNFDLTGVCKQGDDLIFGKAWSLYRVGYTGEEPLFDGPTRIEAKVGPVSFWVMKETPDGRVIFLGSDFNVYMLYGNTLVPVGDNIKKFLKDGVNARLPYATAGLLQTKQQYWLSFTYVSTSTTNDRTLVMDYNRPYQNKWGKLRYPWFIYTIPANCFAEIYTGGKAYLYHGGYVGKMYYNDSGTNDDGSAFTTTAKSKTYSMGDTTIEKKYDKIMFSYENKGDWDITITTVCDGNANTQRSFTQNMLGGSGYNTLWDVGLWDVDYWASETDIDTGRDISRTGKLIDVTIGATGLNYVWKIYSYTILAKALRRSLRTRESS